MLLVLPYAMHVNGVRATTLLRDVLVPVTLPLASVPEITKSKETVGPDPDRLATQLVFEQRQTQ